MKTSKSNAGNKSTVLFQAGLLALILAVLFWRSFLPGYVHFSNDGPLGQQNTAYSHLPDAFNGIWLDLNDVGMNGGIMSLSVSTLLKWILGPVGYSKFYAPVALMILGLGAWSFFRALKLTALAAVLGALATLMSATFFGGACWGVAAAEIAMGMIFFALGLATANTPETPMPLRLTRLALAGMCVGLNVIEGADVGALCSVFAAIYIFCHSLFDEGTDLGTRILHGVGRVTMVAVLAMFLAIQAVVSLVSTNITGVVGTSQDTQTKQEHWDFATQFSLPKKETLGFFVPGLFGYKYDTPNNMMPAFKDDFTNGIYWGGIGRSPVVDRFLDSGDKGPLPGSGLPFGYAGYYCGILVILVALWASAQSFREENCPFSATQKKFVWFWTAVMVLSLLFAWGRFAPMFYGSLYKLPYFSTIRNPTKFIIFICCGLTVLFAYGVNVLNRRYLEVSGPKPAGTVNQLQIWWKKAAPFDRNWALAWAGLVLAAIVGWFIYDWRMPQVIQYLGRIGFSDDSSGGSNTAIAIAAFSLHEAGWFIFLLIIAVGLLVLTIAGCFSGPRAKIGMALLGAFLIFDLGRADLPWINHWDYLQKYEIGTLNPIVSFLRDKPYEHRVAYAVPQPLQTPSEFMGFQQLYQIEWMQHHFPYYNIQCLDLIQQPRMASDMQSYLMNFGIRPMTDADGRMVADPKSYPEITRHWELTNTRYLLGPAGIVDFLNSAFDPDRHSFSIVQRFTVALKPGVSQYTGHLEQITAVPTDNGEYALINFGGALPRAKLYSSWQVNTNDKAVLDTLANLSFTPAKTVLISTPEPGLPAMATNDNNSGTVDFKSYAPTHIVLAANATSPSVLLLNDKYDATWKVLVDGQPAPLLRCNFIMRGIYLQPGQHTVDFSFRTPDRWRAVTLTAVAVGILLCIALGLMTRKTSALKRA